MITFLALVAAQAVAGSSGDVAAKYEAAWAACRNEKGNVSADEEMKGCEVLIAADGIRDEVKAVAHANRGMLMAQASMLETAKDELDRALAINPGLAAAYYNRALVFEAQGDLESAITDYGAAIQLSPNMVEAYINRGIARANTGQKDLAFADFTQAILLEPDSADIYENRATLLRDMGKVKAAEADEAKARELSK